MKKFLLLFTLFAISAFGQSTTPNIGLVLPSHASSDWDTYINQNFSKLDQYLGGTLALPHPILVPTPTNAGEAVNKAYVDNATLGVSSLVLAYADLTTKTADVGSTSLYTVPSAAGTYFYRASCYMLITTAATTSSTLPQCLISYQSPSSAACCTSLSATQTNSSNTVGAGIGGSVTFVAKPGSVISYYTTAYASNAATEMQFSMYVVLEKVKVVP